MSMEKITNNNMRSSSTSLVRAAARIGAALSILFTDESEKYGVHFCRAGSTTAAKGKAAKRGNVKVDSAGAPASAQTKQKNADIAGSTVASAASKKIADQQKTSTERKSAVDEDARTYDPFWEPKLQDYFSPLESYSGVSRTHEHYEGPVAAIPELQKTTWEEVVDFVIRGQPVVIRNSTDFWPFKEFTCQSIADKWPTGEMRDEGDHQSRVSLKEAFEAPKQGNTKAA